MLRELIVPIAEFLFWLTNGELLINTLLFFPWILFWSIIMVLPIFYATKIERTKFFHSLLLVVSIVGFFPSLLMAMGPSLVQMTLIGECRTVSAEVTIKDITETQTVSQCRAKKNFYDTEYGPWIQSKKL